MKKSLTISLTVFILMFASGVSAKNDDLHFKAGAARVDITPSESELPRNMDGILDRLYSRAIVVENGVTSAALITVDTCIIFDSVWKNLTQRIEKELDIQSKMCYSLRPTPTAESCGLNLISKKTYSSP